MNAEQAQVVQALAAVAQGVIGVVLTVLVYRATNRISQLQYTRSIFDAWLAVDTKMLEHADLLQAYASLESPERKSQGTEQARKRVLGYLILNPLASIHSGLCKGYLDPKDYPLLEDKLRQILADEDIYRLTQEEIYEAAFAEFCRKITGDVARTVTSAPAPPSPS